MPHQTLSESVGPDLGSYPRTAYELFIVNARKYPKNFALACLHQSATLYSSVSKAEKRKDHLLWTFEELDRVSFALARSLAAAGIRAGERIAAFISNGAEFYIAFRAGLILNCPFAPIASTTVKNIKYTKNIFDVIKPSVVIADEFELAQKLSEIVPEALDALKLRLVGGEKTDDIPSSWRSLAEFMEPDNTTAHDLEDPERRPDDVVIIYMTSGTTSLPKGCPHTNVSATADCRAQAVFCGTKPGERIQCAHLQTTHAWGAYQVFGMTSHGSFAVHPSSFFEPGASLRAIEEYKCTDVGGVGAMYTAMMEHPDFSAEKVKSVQYTMLSATTASPIIYRQVSEAFGSKTTDLYGMSELGCGSVQNYADLTREVPDHVTSGPAAPGAKLRVCDYKTGKIVERGTLGELHVGGIIIVHKYWTKDGESTDDFYTDEGGTWLRTGDQCIMNAAGEIDVLGRFKHLISRGGEKISPAVLEHEIAAKFDIEVDVIGVPDEIAGEVPIAVVDCRHKPVPVAEIKHTVVEKLGPTFALDEVLDLEQLGLDKFPKNLSGKVEKHVLRDIVIKKMKQNSKKEDKSIDEEEMVMDIWSDILGFDQDKLKPDTNITELADSLTLARFPAQLKKRYGRSISLQQVVDNNTPAAQAKIISQNVAHPQVVFQQHDGPPELVDMIHAAGDPKLYEKTKSLVLDTLKPLDLGWDDVQDILPAENVQATMLHRRRPQSWNRRQVYVLPGLNVQDAKTALIKTLSRHDIMRSMAVYLDDSPFFIVMRASERWFSKCILEAGSAETGDDLKSLFYNDKEKDHASFPGPLGLYKLVHVKKDNCAGMIWNLSHSTLDAISSSMFMEDFHAFVNKENVSTHNHLVPWKAYADHCYNLRNSPMSQVSVQWHVHRLQGLAKHHKSLFPPQKVPEWFRGSSQGWIDPSTHQPGVDREPLDRSGKYLGAEGLHFKEHFSGLNDFKKKNNIDIPIIFKAALSILNTKKTKQNVALFSQYQAGRSWPHVPAWQQEMLPLAMNIAGPTLQMVCLIVPVDTKQSIMSLLKMLKDEQTELNKHGHAPQEQIVALLKKNDEVDGFNDAYMYNDIQRRQVFNWIIGANSKGDEKAKALQVAGRGDSGLQWSISQIEQETMEINVGWDDAQTSAEEINTWEKEYVAIVKNILKAADGACVSDI